MKLTDFNQSINKLIANETVNTTIKLPEDNPSTNLAENIHLNRTTATNEIDSTTVIESIEPSQKNLTKSSKQTNVTTTESDSIIVKSSDEGIENNRGFFYRILNNFDRHTLIMVTAFLIGLILIGALIAASICICNRYRIFKTYF